MGDIAGAAILQLLLLLGPHRAVTPILLVTGALAAVSFWITRRMDAAYSGALEKGLVNRAVVLHEADVQDSTTLAALLHTTTFARRPAQPRPAEPKAITGDPVMARLADLRSGTARRVQSALSPHQPYDPAVVPFAIRLLAWSESFDWSRAFLLRFAHRAVGQLVDALLDPEQDFAVRRRIPHILAYTSSQRAVDGLMEALGDPHFEIRFNTSRAIEFLHRMEPGLAFDREKIMAAAEREVASSHSVRQSRKLLDAREALGGQAAYLDDVLRDRADHSLEHVFSLLAILLPAGPLKIAFRGLHSQDRMLRGLALEFLESHLSAGFVSKLRLLVDSPSAAIVEPAQTQLIPVPAASQPGPLCAHGGPA